MSKTPSPSESRAETARDERPPGVERDICYRDRGHSVRSWAMGLDNTGERPWHAPEAGRTDAALQRRGERYTFLLRLSDALRPLRDASDVQVASMRLIAEHLDVARASYFKIDPDSDGFTLTASYERGVEALPEGMRISDFARDMAEGYRSGRTFILEDTEADIPSAHERAAYRAIGVRAAIGVPLVKDGNLVAVFGVHSTTPRHWTRSEVQLLEDVADRIWAALERASAETALSESEARFRALATVGSSSVYRMSPDWTEMQVLDGAGFLIDTERPTADWVDTYIPADERTRVRDAISRAISAKDVFELEHRVLRGDSSTGWTFSRAIPLFDDLGEIREWFGAATDVTARVKADQSFRRLFDASPAPFLVVKPDAPRFTIFEVNDAYLAATMRTRETVVGRGIFEAYPDNPAARASGVSSLRASLERVLATREPDALPGLNYDIIGQSGQFEERWWSPINSPVLDENGEVEAIVHNANDVTEARRAEAALRDSQERQAFLLKFSDALRPLGDPLEVQAEALRVLGEHLGATRTQYWEVEPDGEHARSEGGYVRGAPRISGRVRLNDFGVHVIDALAAGETVAVSDVKADALASEEVAAAYDGVGVGAGLTLPLVKGGRLVALLGISHIEAREWTTQQIAVAEEVAERTWAAVERARTEVALRQSEDRFAQFAASSTDVLWIRRADTMDMEYVSPAFATVYGMDPNQAMGAVRHWAALIVPDDRDVALEHLETARQGEATVHEFRIRRPSDGAFRWIRDHDFPLSDQDGVKWIGGIGTDVTEAKLLAEHQSVLLSELQHRVRNIMAMLRSLVARTAAAASGAADYGSLRTGRLMALARTQALLTRAASVGVEIKALILQELEAVASHDGQYVLTGPKVVISPKAAEVISLAVHELATNALKYGAFSTPEGTVEVNVEVLQADAATRLRLAWSERRPTPPDWSPPTRKGLGTQLIEQRVPYELRGRGEVVIASDGAKAVIEFPLQPGASILETNAPMPSLVYGGQTDMTGEASLAGQSVLILEDDFYLAQDATSALRDAGAEVIGPFATTAEATDAIENRRVTAAMLDINLGQGPSFEVAHAMRGAGAPFVFVTGYDQDTIPVEFADVLRLEKPIGARDIVRAIGALAAA